MSAETMVQYLGKKWRLILLLIVIEEAAGLENLRCPPWATSSQCYKNIDYGDEYFFIVEGNTVRINYRNSLFHLTCTENITLENKLLPVFDKEIVVKDIQLSECKPPTGGFASVLRSLNVTSQRALILDSLASQPSLSTRHFKDLNITILSIKAPENTKLRPERDFLESLDMLNELHLVDVSIDVNVTYRLPSRLKVLELKRTGIQRLAVAALTRLPLLETLSLTESRINNVDLHSANALREVFIDAPINGFNMSRSIQKLWLWRVRNASLSGDCGSLRVIHVNNVTEELPSHWLSECPHIEDVWVEILREGRAGREEWHYARGILNLQLRHGSLRTLPEDWLAHNVELLSVDLSFNELETLPREIFRSNTKLQKLDLSNNKLRAESAKVLQSLRSLQILVLAYNPLGSLCGGSTYSSLNSLRNLRELWLGRTGATSLCRDWREELPQLERLDLAGNSITHLRFTDLQWTNIRNLSVILKYQTLNELVYSRDDYKDAMNHQISKTSTHSVNLLVNWKLHCDCTAYWAARALRERPAHAPVQVAEAMCSDGVQLRNHTDEQLVCTVPEGLCPVGCNCTFNDELIVWQCAGRQLQELPRVLAPLRSVRLLNASRNNLTGIRPLEVIRNLTTLDISDNQISTFDSATMAALSANPDLRLYLAGNPIDCDCATLPLLRTLVARAGRLPDLQRATCADGRPLAIAAAQSDSDCEVRLWWLATMVAVLLLISVGFGAALYQPASRLRFKAYLFERGLCINWLLRPHANSDDEDASRPYDAFVSFSHLDASYAAELSARLEQCARPWRLCLHERDWTPGEWIPAQIAASVRGSRRTLVLLSEHFLSSEWGCAELRVAYEAVLREQRPRLLLLLLPSLPPARAAAAAPPELRAYLASVTYLLWDDPQFWNKLRRALPSPRDGRSTPDPQERTPSAA